MTESDYNLYAFERLVRDVPSTKALIYLITISSLIYSTAIHFFIDKQISWRIGSSLYAEIIMVAILVFLLPAIISGELYHRVLSRVRKNWSFAIAFIGETIFFCFLLLMKISESVQLSWKFYWAGVLSVFLVTYTILVLSAGNHGIRKLGILSICHSLMLIAPAYYLIAEFQAFTRAEFASKLGIIFVTGLILIVLVIIHEYLMKVNISDISGSNLTSGLLQSKEEELLAGYPARPKVFNLEIENEKEKFSFGAPWVHPGPLGGFGGATMTKKIIEEKNRDGQGFFLHLPSTHQSDPVNPEASEKLINAFKEPEKSEKASKLIERKYENITFRGRKLGDKKLVYVETTDFDDFEKEIFMDHIDDDVLIFDQHNHPDHRGREVMHNSSVNAEKLRENLDDFLKELDDQELYQYKAGFSTDPDGKALTALVEEVNGQKTLLLGSDENGPCKSLIEAKEGLEKHFDEVNIFTTDTHEDLKDLASKRSIDRERITQAADKAENSVSKAKIGFESSRSEEINLLHRDYYGLMHSINILTRLFPLSVIILYISAILWII